MLGMAHLFQDLHGRYRSACVCDDSTSEANWLLPALQFFWRPRTEKDFIVDEDFFVAERESFKLLRSLGSRTFWRKNVGLVFFSLFLEPKKLWPIFLFKESSVCGFLMCGNISLLTIVLLQLASAKQYMASSSIRHYWEQSLLDQTFCGDKNIHVVNEHSLYWTYHVLKTM